MAYWELAWKALFIGGIAVFALMSLWVTVAGFGDIRRLLAGLRKKSDRKHQRKPRRRATS